MTDTYEISNEIEQLTEEFKEKVDDLICRLPLVRAEDMGLDYRCGSAFVSEDAIYIKTYSKGTWDYYAGFEYVDSEQVRSVGSFTEYRREYEDEWIEDDDGKTKSFPSGRIDAAISRGLDLLDDETKEILG